MSHITKLALWMVCLGAIVTALFVGFGALQANRHLAWAGQKAVYPVRFEMPLPSAEPRAALPAVVATDPAKPQVVDASTNAPSARAITQNPDIMPGLIPVNFKLGGATGGSSINPDQLIQTTMPLMYNSGLIGSVPIWIDPNGAITIDSGKLSQALASANGPLSEAIASSGQERVSFSSLRSRGMTINYDPIANRIVMAYRS